MKRNILILEDKKTHRDTLYKIVSDLEQDVTIYAVPNVQQAYQIAMTNHIHLFLMEIILCPEYAGDVTGLRFAQEIRTVKKYQFTPIIFITSLEDPKLYSYSHLHCWNYIEKPFNPAKVRETVLEALNFPVYEDIERFAYFRKDGIIYAKKIKDIIYIENRLRKITIYSRDAALEISYRTCKRIMEELNSELFVQCSRYVIVNRSYVEEIDFANRYLRLRHTDNLIEIGTVIKRKLKKELMLDNRE